MYDYEGAAALGEVARRWALHDGTIRQIAVTKTAGYPTIDVVCIARPESAVLEARLRFEGVNRFEFGWAGEQEFYLVSSYKALVLASGMIYLSLDPFDERSNEQDERDCSVIVAQRVRVQFTAKD